MDHKLSMRQHLSHGPGIPGRFLLVLMLSVILLVLSTGIVFAQTFPRPVGYVNDFAGLLSSSSRTQLEARLVQLEKDTTAEVVVVTVNNLNGEPIEFYANALFNEWGIGKKDKNNGVLFLVALVDRETWIEVGYGLEPIITDSRAGRILDRDVIPEFKNGDYEAGIVAGSAAIEEYIRTATPPSAIEENSLRSFVKTSDLWIPLLFGLGFISIYMMGWMARTKSIWLGGLWGIGAGLVLGFALGNLAAIIGLPIGLGFFGTLLDIILSRNYKSRSSSGRSTGWRSSWGGFSGGGGGFSSGGFGGFGGGHSGGGGAGRGW